MLSSRIVRRTTDPTEKVRPTRSIQIRAIDHSPAGMKVCLAGEKHVFLTFVAQTQNLSDSKEDALWDHILRVLRRYWGNYWKRITVDDVSSRGSPSYLA
jgi:hypothetical protein